MCSELWRWESSSGEKMAAIFIYCSLCIVMTRERTKRYRTILQHRYKGRKELWRGKKRRGSVNEENLLAYAIVRLLRGHEWITVFICRNLRLVKQAWTKFIPVVLMSNAEELPSTFCRIASESFERFLANCCYESGSEFR